jgi:hypothetical protein
VVIHDLDFVGVSVAPGETDPPLIVDSDAVVAFPVSSKGFQSIARRDPEIREALGVLSILSFRLAARSTSIGSRRTTSPIQISSAARLLKDLITAGL